MKWIRDVLIGICLVSILTFFMRDLALPGLPMFHDSNPHIARAIAYHTALLDGQYPPMWAKEVLGGIGSPVLMLNYQLPYMLGEMWHRLGASIFTSYKITLGVTFILSGVLMFLALRVKLSRSASWIGAIIYCLAPYRFVDIFVRGALGESMSFLFPPLLILGLSWGSLPLLIVGWCGLFLTHPVAAAAFSAFFLGYVLIGNQLSLREKMRQFFIPYFVALAIAMFNILPTLALTKFTYYEPSLSDTLLMFPTLKQLFHSPWGYGVSLPGDGDGLSFELGIIPWIVLIAGSLYGWYAKHATLRYISTMMFLTLALMLPISTGLYRLFLGNILDFPWRLLLCMVFGAAWMGGLLVDRLNNRLWQKLAALLVTIMMIGAALPMAHTNEYWNVKKGLKYFARETGDSYGEYAPRTRQTRDSAPFGKRIEFVQGEGIITTLAEKSNYQKYKIVTAQSGVVRINTAFFPGWQMPGNCFVTQRTLSHIDDSGLMDCTVLPGEQEIEIRFVAPPVQKIGNLITLVGICTFLWITFRSYYPHSTKRRQ